MGSNKVLVDIFKLLKSPITKPTQVPLNFLLSKIRDFLVVETIGNIVICQMVPKASSQLKVAKARVEFFGKLLFL